MITDDQTLNGATSRFDSSIPVYDDGYGPLFILRNTYGICAIVRAQTWEDAWSICEDEFFPDATETHEEWVAEHGEDYQDDGAWQENYGYRNNASASGCCIYQKDIHGDYLDALTPAMVVEWEIKLAISDPEPEPEPPQHFHSFHLRRRPMGRRGLYVGAWSGRYGTKGSGAFACHKRHLARHSVW